MRSFELDLNWSRQEHFQRQELALLRSFFHGAEIRTTSTAEDMKGGDYAADYPARTFFVDVKRRRRGASRFWTNGEPEIPVELPTATAGADLFKKGSITDFRLYVFDGDDFPDAILIRHAALKEAASINLESWTRRFKTAEQTSTHNGRAYQSRVVFVPLHELVRAGVHVKRIPLNQKNSSAA